MKTALIIQRFGENILGGAESHCYQLATQLADKLGWTVHVYTTTAFSYQTWSNFYPTGQENSENMTVYRYNTLLPRWPKLFGAYNRLFSPFLIYSSKNKQVGFAKFMGFLAKTIEKLWFILQGPWCPTLISDLRTRYNEYDRFIFFTYLYYPTVFGAHEFKDKTVLVPLAHDEPALNFPRIRELLKNTPLLLANTEVEKKLIINKGLALDHQIGIVGCGIDDKYFLKPEDQPRLAIRGIEKPYIAYLGRISKGKGVFVLIQYFLQFIIRTRNTELLLILAGENDGSLDIFYHPQIKYIGYISENDKLSLIAHSICVVNPSPHESLSLLALEAIALQKPVLVNYDCPVLNYYAENLSTVFAFKNSSDFDSYLVNIFDVRQTDSFKKRLEDSQRWVAGHYSWNKVLDSFQQCLQISGKRG